VSGYKPIHGYLPGQQQAFEPIKGYLLSIDYMPKMYLNVIQQTEYMWDDKRKWNGSRRRGAEVKSSAIMIDRGA